MMGQAMRVVRLGLNYSRSCAQSPGLGLSSALIQMLASISWNASTAMAAAKPTPERIFSTPSLVPSSSSSSRLSVEAEEDDGNEVPNGWVGT